MEWCAFVDFFSKFTRAHKVDFVFAKAKNTNTWKHFLKMGGGNSKGIFESDSLAGHEVDEIMAPLNIDKQDEITNALSNNPYLIFGFGSNKMGQLALSKDTVGFKNISKPTRVPFTISKNKKGFSSIKKIACGTESTFLLTGMWLLF